MSVGAAMLELNDIHTFYGAIHALRGVTLNVEEGEIVTATMAHLDKFGPEIVVREISDHPRRRVAIVGWADLVDAEVVA